MRRNWTVARGGEGSLLNRLNSISIQKRRQARGGQIWVYETDWPCLFIRSELYSLGSPAPGGPGRAGPFWNLCGESRSRSCDNHRRHGTGMGPGFILSSFRCQKVKPTDVKRTNVV